MLLRIIGLYILVISIDNLYYMSQSRLELLTTRLSGVHSNQLSYWLLKSLRLSLNKITLGKTRTFNPQIRSLILYPIEPRARSFLSYISLYS